MPPWFPQYFGPGVDNYISKYYAEPGITYQNSISCIEKPPFGYSNAIQINYSWKLQTPFRLNQDSVATVLGTQPNAAFVMVYGFNNCMYVEVAQELRRLHYSAENILEPEASVYANATSQDMKQRNFFKVNLDAFVFLNFLRYLADKPLFTLLYVIGLQDRCSSHELKLNWIVHNKGVSNSELRRIYKYQCRIAPEYANFRSALEKSIRFVELTYINNEYRMQRVEPFWRHRHWDEKWQQRPAKESRGKWMQKMNSLLGITLFKHPQKEPKKNQQITCQELRSTL